MFSQAVGQSASRSVGQRAVAGVSVSTNFQEFWSSDLALNLQDIKSLNVGSSVKKLYKGRYVKRWTPIKPKQVDKHGDH